MTFEGQKKISTLAPKAEASLLGEPFNLLGEGWPLMKFVNI